MAVSTATAIEISLPKMTPVTSERKLGPSAAHIGKRIRYLRAADEVAISN